MYKRLTGLSFTAIESYRFSIAANRDFKAVMGCTTHKPGSKTLSYQWFQRNVSVFTRISDRGLMELWEDGQLKTAPRSTDAQLSTVRVWSSGRSIDIDCIKQNFGLEQLLKAIAA